MPVPQTPIAQRELVDQLAEGLASLLVQEYRRRHPQHNQQDLAATVASPSGPHRTDQDRLGPIAREPSRPIAKPDLLVGEASKRERQRQAEPQPSAPERRDR